MLEEQERKDIQEEYYQEDEESPEREEEEEQESDPHFREYINLGDLMSAKKTEQRSQNAESFE